MIDDRYLHRVLTSPTVREHFLRVASKTAQPALSLGKIRATKIPLPASLQEQKRIARILDAADALRALRRESIAQLDALVQSTFLEMFGDPRKNTKSFKVSAISEVSCGWKSGANLKPDDFLDTGCPVLHKGATHRSGRINVDSKKKAFVSYERSGLLERSLVGRGYTVVTLRDLVPTGPSIGLAAHLSEEHAVEYLLAQGAYGFRLDTTKICPSYFVALTNNQSFRLALKQISVGSTQIHIRRPIF